MKKVLFILMALVALTACHKKPQQEDEEGIRVHGRYVPERKDDFAWENEYAAWRMYGPALRGENPSNGVDLWLKASPELVVDSFYYREHVLGMPYHINYGKGMDAYKVGHTCGAGGLVVMADGQTYIGGAYDRWEIIEQTPKKLVFRLEYDSLQVGDQILRESITITSEAGKMLNKAEVVLTARDSDAVFEDSLLVGGGIYLHDTIEHYVLEEGGIVAYAENAASDKTAARMNYEFNGTTSFGRSYIAVVTPDATEQGIIDGNLVSLKTYAVGDTLTYYFGACWSQWARQAEKKELPFNDDDKWYKAVKEEVAQ